LASPARGILERGPWRVGMPLPFAGGSQQLLFLLTSVAAEEACGRGGAPAGGCALLRRCCPEWWWCVCSTHQSRGDVDALRVQEGSTVVCRLACRRRCRLLCDEGVLVAWVKDPVSALCPTSDGGGCGCRLPSWRHRCIAAAPLLHRSDRRCSSGGNP
jgi:hypothetical protein